MKKVLFIMLFLMLGYSVFAEGLTKNEEFISSNDEIIQPQEIETQIQNNEDQNIPQDTKKQNAFSKFIVSLENDKITQIVGLSYDFKQKKIEGSLGIREKGIEVSLGISKNFLIEVNKIYFGETSGVYLGSKFIDPFDRFEVAPLVGARMQFSDKVIAEIEYSFNIETKEDLGAFAFKYVFW